MIENIKQNNQITESDENQKVYEASIKFLNYLNINEEPSESDVIFILGGSSLAPVEKAIELYKAGFAQKIAFISVGGKFGGEKVWGIPENEKYKNVLEKAGIPSEAIVTQGKTTNTLAEAQAAIPFIKENGINTNKIILVSRPIHQRRAFLTFKKQHPETQYVNCPANETYDINDPETQERLVQEAERLLDYSSKGDIEKEQIPKDILEAAVIIRKELKVKGIYKPRIKPNQKIN